jgi:hypothetical protein
MEEWIAKQQKERPWLPRTILSAVASLCMPDAMDASLKGNGDILILQLDGFYPANWEDVMKSVARNNGVRLCRAFVYSKGAYASFVYTSMLQNKAFMAKEDCVRKYWNKNIRWLRQMGVESFSFPYREEDNN